MNCSQAQKISIRKVLESFSLFPSKENSKTAFYFAIDREEKTPSLSVDFVKNTAFDFGTGRKYDVVSLVQAVKKCSVSEALSYLENFEIEPLKQGEKTKNSELKNYKILKIQDEISHPALRNYLKKRKVFEQKNFVKEIHFELKNSAGISKNYFGIGFKNDSGGFEIRNEFYKGCLLKKDVALIKNEDKTLRIFEAFFDFLSFKQVEKNLDYANSDYLILNSVSLSKKVKLIAKNYSKIELYLDNDEAGNTATSFLKSEIPDAEDCRILYRNFKDLNDFLTGGKAV